MTPLPPDAGPFLAAVADAPDDAGARLVFADWLEERGRPGAAAASRWLAAGNRPVHYGDWLWFVWSPQTLAFWATSGGNPRREGLLPEVPAGVPLPGPAFCGEGVTAGYFQFPSRESAELALLEGWPDGVRSACGPDIRSCGRGGVGRATREAASAAGLTAVPRTKGLGEPGRRKANAESADATLVLSRGEPIRVTREALRLARTAGKSVFVADLDEPPDPRAIADWARLYVTRELNVAGPREREQPGVYERSLALLTEVFRLMTGADERGRRDT